MIYFLIRRKFRNFWNSAWAIRRINDKLCLEHGLSVVGDPQASKSNYATWLGDDQKLSYLEQLRRIIDTVLEEKPKDFADFALKCKMTAALNFTSPKRDKKYSLTP